MVGVGKKLFELFMGHGMQFKVRGPRSGKIVAHHGWATKKNWVLESLKTPGNLVFLTMGRTQITHNF